MSDLEAFELLIAGHHIRLKSWQPDQWIFMRDGVIYTQDDELCVEFTFRCGQWERLKS